MVEAYGVDNLIAVVTGGAGGIGRAIVKILQRDGARVIACDFNAAELDKLASESSSGPNPVVCRAFDITSTDQCMKMLADIKAGQGTPDILVNCAAVGGRGTFELPEETWVKAIQVKFLGYMRMMGLVLPVMSERRFGRIVNVTGQAADYPSPVVAVSGVNNSALINFCAGIAPEYVENNVLINCVAPGVTRTQKSAGLLKVKPWPEARVIPPEAIGAAVRLLCDRSLMYVNSSVVRVGWAWK